MILKKSEIFTFMDGWCNSKISQKRQMRKEIIALISYIYTDHQDISDGYRTYSEQVRKIPNASEDKRAFVERPIQG